MFITLALAGPPKGATTTVCFPVVPTKVGTQIVFEGQAWGAGTLDGFPPSRDDGTPLSA